MSGLAEVLGITETITPMGLVTRIEHGLPISAFDRVTHTVAPGDLAFRQRLIPKATLTRRRKTRRLSPSESELVARLAKVWDQALAVYRDPDTARRFLTQPHMLLDHRSPLDVAAATAAGSDLVIELLGRIQYGGAV
ncbi:MAG: DUF2384 domain-containing protein [Alphaproteobacteria bacterium]|nr:DUF2384 domain-containing protein [Alphaproteobacteria bacterium]MBF0391291.1 DUF2384 domain-containing protein [Alphaproteobacteria bacterium]